MEQILEILIIEVIIISFTISIKILFLYHEYKTSSLKRIILYFNYQCQGYSKEIWLILMYFIAHQNLNNIQL